MSPQLAAQVFTALIAVVVAFQLALAAGAPLGRYAMGGAFPGVYPPRMRAAAVVQAVLLGLVALVVMSRSGLVLPEWRDASRWIVWAVVGLLGLGVIMNLITPSRVERILWTPVAAALFAAALVVALSR